MDLYMYLLMFATIFLNLILTNLIKKRDYVYNFKVSEKNKQLNYIYRLFYIPQLIREVKTSNLSSFALGLKSNFDKCTIELIKANIKEKMPYQSVSGIWNLLESSFVALYFGVSVVLKKIAISQYFTYVNAYSQFKNTILQFGDVYSKLYSNSMYARDYIEFLNSEESHTLNTSGETLDKINEIEFCHVTFRYPNCKSNALYNISFKISAGEKTAVIGKNGAGKTTIIKLLLRLYDPQSGEIFVNHKNIKQYNTESLRNAICVLFQDYAIYAFSIRDNISLGRKIEEKKIWDALEQMDLKEKINGFERSIDTPITSQLYPDGVELSGGESQKMAICRLYVSNASVLAMDEPTSSLDPRSEYLLYKRIMEEKRADSIFIVISHRLTLTYKMSKIIVIDNGHVAEQGTHEELMKNRSIYYEMYQLQANKYIDMQDSKE